MNVVEAIWTGDYAFVFCLSALRTPVACLFTLIFISNFNSELRLPGNVTSSDRLFVLLFFIILFNGVKRFYVNKYYLKLLERRLKDKLKDIDSWQVILSSLASDAVHSRLRDQSGHLRVPLPLVAGNLETLQHSINLKSISTSEEVDDDGSFHSTPQDASSDTQPLAYHDQPTATEKVILNVFEEIVNATRLLDLRDDNGVAAAEELEDGDELVQQLKARNSFWERAQAVKSGTFKIFTAKGVVKLRNKHHASAFAKRLYLHLTKGATKPLTSCLIADTIKKDENIPPADKKALLDAINLVFKFTYDNSSASATVVNVGVSQAQMISAVQHVFWTHRHAATSLSDLQV
jgi:hypothetical protein